MMASQGVAMAASAIIRPIWLASRSPRRRQLMIEAGFDVRVMAPDIDDGRLRHGSVPPEWWVMALAYLKARRVADILRASAQAAGGIVIGADTVCAVGRSVLGQPRDADDARRMLTLMRNREHRTITGVCLLRAPESARVAAITRLIVFDAAVVHIGDISDRQIEAYLQSGDWRGKAGAYNLAERIDAGWSITCMGDPTTVMGLPMQRLRGWLAKAM
jgi:septum formation protein